LVSRRRIGILYVSPVSDRGGAETVLLNLLRFHDRARFTPKTCLLKPGPLADEVIKTGAEAVVLPTDRLRSVSSVAATLAIRRLIRADGVDIVFGNMSMGHLYGGLAALGTSAQAVWFQHGIVVRPDLVDRLAARVPAAVTFAPSAAAGEAQRRLNARTPVRVVHGGIDLDAFDPARCAAGAIRAELGIASDVPVVAMVGRLQRSKGHSLFLEVASRIHRESPRAQFIIAGGTLFGLGEAYAREVADEAARILPGRVHLLGHRDDVPSILAGADVVVECPIDPESFGLAVLEAMAMERPVVSVRAWGPAEIVIDGETGVLVEPGDAGAFARATLRLLNDSAERIAMGRAGRRLVQRRFSAQRMVSDVEGELERVIGERER
jgi:glycosyltransferase involved in cell wall biosynthesis